MKTIILIDDHEMIRVGLRTFLEEKSDCKIIGDAGSIDSALTLLESTLPQIIIIDVELYKDNGFDLAAIIKEKYPEVKIIMYSMHDENDYVLQAKKLKISYISKASESEEFINCIEKVSAGEIYLEERLVENQSVIEDIIPLLSKKENLIFQEMLNGKTNEEISETLNLTKHTVEVYITNIYDKTFCTSRSELLEKYR